MSSNQSPPLNGTPRSPFRAGWKRELVGKFLSEQVQPDMVPRKKAEVCRDMVKACPTVRDVSPRGRCERCKAVMDNFAFDWRVQGPLRKAKGVARQVEAPGVPLPCSLGALLTNR